MYDSEHPESRCEICRRPNPVWFAPSPLWNAVAPSKGIICPCCFATLAEGLGIVRCAWRFEPEMYQAGLSIRPGSVPFSVRSSRREERAVTKNLRAVVYKRDGRRCRYCGRDCSPTELSLDHVVPLSRGGKSTLANLVTACRGCNRTRGNNEKVKPIGWKD